MMGLCWPGEHLGMEDKDGFPLRTVAGNLTLMIRNDSRLGWCCRCGYIGYPKYLCFLVLFYCFLFSPVVCSRL